MKLKLFSKMTAKPQGRKVVRASARAMRGDEDYYESEPNMKLSHAFMVVLVLHIVAVGGIWAFNHINSAKKSASILPELADKLALSSQPKSQPVAVRQPGDADEPLPTLAPHPDEQPEFRTADLSPAPVKAANKPAMPVVETKPPAAKTDAAKPVSASAASAATASGDTYTVAKGDNPYKIAKKLGVTYQSLLDVNEITDPTKLQIGTVLKVPSKKN